MKTFITILLFFTAQMLTAQSPVHTDWDIPTSYSMPTFSKITIFMPPDSATGKHPVDFQFHGTGTIGHYLYTDGSTYDPNTTAAMAKAGTVISSANAKYGGTSSWIIVKIHKPNDGNTSFQRGRLKDAYNFVKAHYLSYMDTTQLYASGLSAGGGAILDMMMEDSAIWRHRFAAYATMAGALPEIAYNPTVIANINSDSIHYRLYWCDDDNSNGGNPQTQNTNLMTSQFGFGNETNTYKAEPIIPMTGGHGGSWLLGYEQGHTTLSVDSSWYRGNSSVTANQNKTYTHTPNLYEWFLGFNNPAVVVTGPPSCTTPASPSSGATVSNATTATVTWNFAATSATYNLYLWSSGSAPGSPTVSGITSLSYNITGLTGSTTYHWFVAPANSFGAATGCSSSATTFVTPAPGTIDSLLTVLNWYDISGAAVANPYNPDYWKDSHGAFNPVTGTNLTGDPSHVWDTANGNAKYNQNRFYESGLNNGINYPGMNRGQLVLLDMVNTQDLSDTSVQAIIRSIHGISNEDAGAVQRFYAIDAGILSHIDTTRDLYIAKFDSLVHPFDSLTTTGYGQYVHKTLSVPVRTRWIGVMATAPTSHTSGFSELAFVGQMSGAITGTQWPDPESDAVVNKQDSSTFITANGINTIKGNDPAEMKYFGLDRIFVGIGAGGWIYNSGHTDSTWSGGYYDTARVGGKNPDHFLMFNVTGTNDVTIPYLKDLLTRQKVLLTWQGAGAANGLAGYSNVNINYPGISHPEIDTSWTRHGKFVFNIAAFFGKNNISTSRTIWSGTGSYTNGQNMAIMSGFSNEQDAHGQTPWAAAVKKAVEYDGDKGRVCADCGIKNADSTFFLLSDATSEADSNAIKVMVLREWWVNHRKPQIKGVDVHHYDSKNDNIGAMFTSPQQVGQTAVPPEQAFAMRSLNALVWDRTFVKTIHRYLPGIPIYKTEANGISSDTTRIRTEADGTGFREMYTTFTVGSLTGEQVKAEMILRNFLFGMFNGFANNVYYEYEHISSDTSNHGLFAHHGLTFGSSIYPPYSVPQANKLPADRAIQSVANAIGGYRKEGDMVLLSGTYATGLWRCKLRSNTNPDSICVEYHLGSLSGATQSITVDFGHTVNTAATRFDPSLSATDSIGTFTSKTASGSTLASQTINENTTYFFAKEVTVSAPSCTTNISPSTGTTVSSQTAATLTWNAASGATSYQVWVDGSLITTVAGTTYNSFGYSAGSSHSWYIVPTNSAGGASGCSANATTFNTAAAGGVSYKTLKIFRK